jgi:mono/diheme cytochrome c family protein
VVAAAAVAAAGCGTGGPRHGGDVARGKQLFLGQGRCSACHTLADAGAQGKIGPNLDNAFAADRAQGYEASGIQQVVLDQIRIPSCVDPNDPTRCMPANLVKGQDAADVSAYVAKCAAVKSCNVQAAAAPAGGGQAGGGAASIFQSQGCGSCHTLKAAGSTGTIGPDLDKLAADARKAGKPLAAYTRESIVNPDAYIVPGYQKGVMPTTFGSKLSKSQLAALVQYLLGSGKGS